MVAKEGDHPVARMHCPNDPRKVAAEELEGPAESFLVVPVHNAKIDQTALHRLEDRLGETLQGVEVQIGKIEDAVALKSRGQSWQRQLHFGSPDSERPAIPGRV
jgi:hypothetical protein